MFVRNARTIFYLIVATQSVADSMVFLTFAVYLVNVVGLNPFQLVLVGTALELGYALLEVPTGVFADTLSRRLSVIIGLFLLGIGFVAEGFFPVFGLILLCETVRGIGAAFYEGANHAWLADEVGEEAVGQIMLASGQVGRIAGFVGLGGAVVLGSLNLGLPFIVGGGYYVLLSVFLIFMMPEKGFVPISHKEAGGMLKTLRQSVVAVRGRPVLLTILAVSFITGAASEGFDRLWEAHLLQGIGLPTFGGIQPIAWFGIIAVVGDVVGIIVVQRLKKRLNTTASVVIARNLLIFDSITVACIIVLALAGNFAVAVVALLVKNSAGSIARPLYDTWLIQNTPSRGRATILSLMGQSNAFGQIAGGPGVGWIGTAFGIRAAIFVAGLLLSPTLLLYARVVRRGEATPIVPDSEDVALELAQQGRTR